MILDGCIKALVASGLKSLVKFLCSWKVSLVPSPVLANSFPLTLWCSGLQVQARWEWHHAQLVRCRCPHSTRTTSGQRTASLACIQCEASQSVKFGNLGRRTENRFRIFFQPAQLRSKGPDEGDGQTSPKPFRDIDRSKKELAEISRKKSGMC